MRVLAFLLCTSQVSLVCAKQEPAGHFVWHRRAPGAHNRTVEGNAWKGHGPVQNKQVKIEDVASKVEKETSTHAHVYAQPQNIKEPSERALVAHFAKRSLRHHAPAPGPSPSPWSEDPQWMVDGARGDKTKLVPITDQFKGLESIPVPEQGFHGRPIRHANGDTYTDDFASEFGPEVDDAFQTCMKQEHRNEFWCKTHLKDLMMGSDAGEAYANAQGLKKSAAVRSTAATGVFCSMAVTILSLM